MALVAIYDSGVGGLSIAEHAMRQCPEHDYIFLSDTAAFPYGTKTEKEILQRSLKLIDTLSQRFKIDVLIVACNTASTIILPSLRERFSFHVIGVVPAIKPAAAISKTKSIGLLATPATISRQYTQDLIDSFAGDCEVTKVGTSELVRLAEDKLSGLSFDQSQLEKELKPLINNTKIDVLVLACTHFPLLENDIRQCFDKLDHELRLIDSGEAIANRLYSMLETNSNASNKKNTRLRNNIALTTSSNLSKALIATLSNYGFNELKELSV